MVDVFVGAERAGAACGGGWIVGAGERGVDVAGEEEMFAAGEEVVGGDGGIFAEGFIDADAGDEDVGRAEVGVDPVDGGGIG